MKTLQILFVILAFGITNVSFSKTEKQILPKIKNTTTYSTCLGKLPTVKQYMMRYKANELLQGAFH